MGGHLAAQVLAQLLDCVHHAHEAAHVVGLGNPQVYEMVAWSQGLDAGDTTLMEQRIEPAAVH